MTETTSTRDEHRRRAGAEGESPADVRSTDWEPSRRVTVLWNVVGLALAVVGTGLFAAAYAARRGGGADVTVTGLGPLLGMVALVAALLALHELLHGAAMRRFGATPKYGAGVLYRLMPYAYCTAPGYRFTRAQYLVIALAPAVAISALGLVCVAYLPLERALVLPLGLHLGGCIGDFWVVALALRQPRGTLFEDLRTGVRLHVPIPATNGEMRKPAR